MKLIGVLKAHLPGGANGKSSYVRIGSVFDKDGNTVVKIDALPTSTRWEGWANVFKDEYGNTEEFTKGQKSPAPKRNTTQATFDDDIPF